MYTTIHDIILYYLFSICILKLSAINNNDLTTTLNHINMNHDINRINTINSINNVNIRQHKKKHFSTTNKDKTICNNSNNSNNSNNQKNNDNIQKNIRILKSSEVIQNLIDEANNTIRNYGIQIVDMYNILKEKHGFTP